MKCLLPTCYKKRVIYRNDEKEFCEKHFNKVLTKLEYDEILIERERLNNENKN